MQYSFKRSSELYLVKDGLGYGISALSDFTISQTISEKTLNRRNLFSRVAPKRIINRVKNVGTGSIDIYYTNNCPCLRMLLEALGLDSSFNNRFMFYNEFTTIPAALGLVVVDAVSGRTITLPKIFLTNMDVQCSPSNISKITFGFVFSESTEDPVPYILNRAVVPQYPVPSYIDFRVYDERVNSVKSAAFTVTKNLKWLSSGANQFNLNQVVGSEYPVITEFNITALATANDNLDSNKYKSLVPTNSDVILGNDAFFISIPSARVTLRKEPLEVYTVNFDIKHQSLSPVLIGGTYNGYIN